MAEIKVLYDNFSLTSKWNCRTVYTYNSTGSFNSSSNTSSGLTVSKKTVRFAVDIKRGSKVLDVKVHAKHTSGTYGGKFRVNGLKPNDDDFVTLEASNLSNGYIEVEFEWTSYTDGTNAHRSQYPSYNGSSSQSKTSSHESTSNITEVYLLVEYELGSVIYHAENGVLVPYQLYYAEDGALTPCQLQYAENNALVKYG